MKHSHTRTLTTLTAMLLLSLILAACGAAPAGSTDIEAAVAAALQATEEASAPQATIEALQTAVAAKENGGGEQPTVDESAPIDDSTAEPVQAIEETPAPEPADSNLPDDAQPITVGSTVSSSTEEQTKWAFQARQGDHVNIKLSMDAIDRPAFTLFDTHGENLGELPGVYPGFLIPEDGTYMIELTELPLTDTPYQLAVTPLETYALGDVIESTSDSPAAWLLQANPGDTIEFTLRMDERPSDLHLTLLDSFGNIIPVVRDDYLDVMRWWRKLPWSDGRYRIILWGFEDDAPFRLTVVDDAEVPPPITIGDTVEGYTWQYWGFSGVAGQEINISMSATRDDGLDTFLRLLDPWGEEIYWDDDGGEGLDSLISIKLPATGEYLILATAANGTSGEYSLTIQQGLAPGADIELVNEKYVTELARFNIDDALAAYRQGVQQGIAYSADTPNSLCWYGAMAGRATQVLDICDLAVSTVEGSILQFGFADSRGVARGTTGDLAGAIEDFEFAVEGFENMGSPRFLINRRQRWLNALKQGDNPFNEWVLNSLRNESVGQN